MERKILGLITAPGYVESIIDEMVDDLSNHLNKYVHDQVEWVVKRHADNWIGGTNRADKAIEWTRFEMADKGWDYAINLTDLPLFEGKRPVAAEIHSDEEIAFISLPSFGFSSIKKHIAEAIVHVTDEMYYGSSSVGRKQSRDNQHHSKVNHDETTYQDAKTLTKERFFESISPLRREAITENNHYYVRFVVAPSFSGLVRILTGMVSANRPLKLFRAFIAIVVIAFTTGAYALVFPSIWGLAGHYHIFRAILLMIVAMVSLIFWIIVSNNLWERRKKNEQVNIRRLYNATTFLTLLLTVVMYYVCLFSMFVITSLLLIPASQVAENLATNAIGLTDYLYTSWLTASLSTIVGALGSAFNNKDVLLNSTYGYRQQQRQKTAEEIEDNAEKQKNIR